MYDNFFTSKMTTVNSLSQQNIQMGYFLVFLEKINLHWFRGFCRSCPRQQHYILLTHVQLQRSSETALINNHNSHLLWAMKILTYSDLPCTNFSKAWVESQLPKTAQVSLISDLLVSFLSLAKSVPSLFLFSR